MLYNNQEFELERLLELPNKTFTSLVKATLDDLSILDKEYGIKSHFEVKHEEDKEDSVTIMIENGLVPIFIIMSFNYMGNYFFEIRYLYEHGGPRVYVGVYNSMKEPEYSVSIIYDYMGSNETSIYDKGVIEEKNGTYYGFIENGVPHGMGLIINNKVVVHGLFKEGNLHGLITKIPREDLSLDDLKDGLEYVSDMNLNFYKDGEQLEVFKTLINYIYSLYDTANNGRGIKIL